MNTYSVTLGHPDDGSATLTVIVYGLSAAMARTTATAHYPGYSVHAVRRHKGPR